MSQNENVQEPESVISQGQSPEVLDATLHENTLIDVFSILLGDAAAKDSKAYQASAELPGVKSAVEAVRERDPMDFERALKTPFERLCDGLLQAETPATVRLSQAKFLFKEIKFVSRQFRWAIERVEGHICMADKTNHIMRCLARHLIDGKPIIFNYNQEYTYHLPKNVFTTEAQILLFFQGVYSLHFGRPDRYMEALNEVLRQPEREAEAAVATQNSDATVKSHLTNPTT